MSSVELRPREPRRSVRSMDTDDGFDEDAFLETTRRMFYRMEGWERFWPYEQRPEWLKVKYP